MTDELRAEKLAKRFWISLVLLLMGLQVAIGGAAVSVITGENGPVVMPDYHQAALDWDQTQRTLGAIKELGWTITLEPGQIVDGNGNRVLRASVVDQAGDGIDGLQWSARAYHHARGHNVVSFEMQSLKTGTYQALAPMTAPGLWHLELKTSLDQKRLVSVHSMELP